MLHSLALFGIFQKPTEHLRRTLDILMTKHSLWLARCDVLRESTRRDAAVYSTRPGLLVLPQYYTAPHGRHGASTLSWVNLIIKIGNFVG